MFCTAPLTFFSVLLDVAGCLQCGGQREGPGSPWEVWWTDHFSLFVQAVKNNTHVRHMMMGCLCESNSANTWMLFHCHWHRFWRFHNLLWYFQSSDSPWMQVVSNPCHCLFSLNSKTYLTGTVSSTDETLLKTSHGYHLLCACCTKTSKNHFIRWGISHVFFCWVICSFLSKTKNRRT